MSPEEAIHFQRLTDMTDNKYSECRNFLKAHNVHIFPTVEEVRQAKESTYPDDITEDPHYIFSSLQDLVDKTVQRTCQVESFKQNINSETDFVVDSKAGSDGMTFDSNYNSDITSDIESRVMFYSNL